MSRKYLCPQEGSVLEILGEREISRAKRFLKEIMNQNGNFQGDVPVGEVGRVGGVGGSNQKSLYGRGTNYFPEQQSQLELGTC